MSKVRRRFFYSLGGFVFLPVVLFIFSILLPWPQSLIRWTALQSSHWMLERPGDFENPFEVIWHKWIGANLEYQLLRSIPQDNSGTDIEWAARQLGHLKPYLLNQFHVMLVYFKGPNLLAGIAACDQVNGIASKVLSQRFAKVETYDLFYKDMSGGHTIFRFFSAEKSKWIYGDLWSDEIRLYEASRASIKMLWTELNPKWPPASEQSVYELIDGLYLRTEYGQSLQQYQGTFISFLWDRSSRLIREKWRELFHQLGSGELSTLKTSVAGSFTNPMNPTEILNESAAEREARINFSRLYIEARLAHWYGSKQEAARLYSLAYEMGKNQSQRIQSIAKAAQIFSENLKLNY